MQETKYQSQLNHELRMSADERPNKAFVSTVLSVGLLTILARTLYQFLCARLFMQKNQPMVHQNEDIDPMECKCAAIDETFFTKTPECFCCLRR